jgi:epoxyqueuosine reductase
VNKNAETCNCASREQPRFDHKNTCLCRGFWDPAIMPFLERFASKWFGVVPLTGTKGFSPMEFAFRFAGWSVNDYASKFSEFGVQGSGLYSWDKQEPPWMDYVKEHPVVVEDKQRMSTILKAVARKFGADLVGLCEINERWVYSHCFNPLTNVHQPNPLRVPQDYRYAVVMALEMDYDLFNCAPGYLMSGAVGREYSRMAVVSTQVATFIRSLGYRAVAAGNDTALSIPLAIDAGLGEQSRLGLLMTKEFGPRVRLCKVFTDLPLMPDTPQSSGLEEFCKGCNRCVKSCPSQAIPSGDQTTEGQSMSNFNGLKRWYLNPEKCLAYFDEIGTDCGMCIRACPKSKPTTIHQRNDKLKLIASDNHILATLGTSPIDG